MSHSILVHCLAWRFWYFQLVSHLNVGALCEGVFSAWNQCLVRQFLTTKMHLGGGYFSPDEMN
jgi:hypothetical protein